jgi:RNA polymerase sigma factor (sigma-70 family)
MTPSAGERALIERAKAGSTSAFSQLLDAHQQAVRTFLRRLCGPWAEADDLAQDVFVDAWLQLRRFDVNRSLRSWLFGIAYRKYLMSRRGFFRRRWREGATADGDGLVEDPRLVSETRLDLSRALQTLPAPQRAAVALCLAGGYSHTEAAEALGMPLGTVKSLVLRGREKLLAALGDYRDE